MAQTKSLYELWFPEGESIAQIVGERTPGDVRNKDRCRFQAKCVVNPPNDRKKEYTPTTADMGYNELQKIFGDVYCEVSGGPLAAIPTIHMMYPRVDAPYKLGDMKNSSDECEWQFAYNLWDPVLRRINELGEATFEELYGFNRSNYLEMPHKTLQLIGIVPEGKETVKVPEGKLKVPNWSVLNTGDGTEYIPTDIPFSAGGEFFLIFAGKSPYNPEKKMVSMHGCKGVGTQAAGLAEANRSQIKKGEETYSVVGVSEFVKKYDDIFSAGKVDSVAMLGYATAINGMPTHVVPIEIATYWS